MNDDLSLYEALTGCNMQKSQLSLFTQFVDGKKSSFSRHRQQRNNKTEISQKHLDIPARESHEDSYSYASDENEEQIAQDKPKQVIKTQNIVSPSLSLINGGDFHPFRVFDNQMRQNSNPDQNFLTNIGSREISRSNFTNVGNSRNIQQNPESSKKKIFLNNFLLKSDFTMLDCRDGTEDIPLILDKSDKILQIKESSNQVKEEGKNNQTYLNYDNIEFDTGNYYNSIKGLPPKLGLEICHSDVAQNLYLIDPNPKDIESLHHPRLNVKEILGKSLTVSIDPKMFNNEDDEHIFLKDFESLSARNGKKIILLELVSESPAFILNVGMASKLVTYYHQSSPDDKPRLETDTRIEYIDPEQKSPMLAPIPKSTPFTTISTNLHEIPVAKHPVENTDLLMIRDMEDNTKFYLRKINDLYCGSLMEVRCPVLCPTKKNTEKINKKLIAAIVINILRGTCQYKGRESIRISDVIKEYFPEMSEPKLREIIKDFCCHVRQNKASEWVPKLNLDQYFSSLYITPEDVCSLQSMFAGLKRLRRNGVHFLINGNKINQQIHNLQGKLTKQIAERIELELMRTPWSRTENFATVYGLVEKEKTEISDEELDEKLRNKGISDAEISKLNRKGKEKLLKAKIKEKIQGTDSDFRALTNEELANKLVKLGVDRNEISRLGKWDRVHLFEDIINKLKEQGIENEETKKYSRDRQSQTKIQKEKYMKIYEQTFQTNYSFICSSNSPLDPNENVEVPLELARRLASLDSDDEFDDDKIPDFTENTSEETNDPKELVKYGVCTYHFNVDWNELGFGNYQQRKVVKIINISYQNKQLNVSVEWERQPHQIKKYEKLDNFVNNQVNIARDNLNSFVMKTHRKSLKDKVRRIRSQKKKGSVVEGYILFDHSAMLVQDPNGALNFIINPEIIKKIESASREYEKFMKSSKSSGKTSKVKINAVKTVKTS